MTEQLNGDGNKLVLTVTLDATGQVEVSGPLGQKVACLGMLAEAANIVHDWHRRRVEAQQARQKAVRPGLCLPDGTPYMGGKVGES